MLCVNCMERLCTRVLLGIVCEVLISIKAFLGFSAIVEEHHDCRRNCQTSGGLLVASAECGFEELSFF